MSEFLAQERITLEVGPRRLALAVNDGDVEQLTLAMRAASSMWGGRRFPILPVGEDSTISPWGMQFADVLQSAIIVDFSGKLSQAGSATCEKRQIPVQAARPLEDARLWSPSAIVSYSLDSLAELHLHESASDDPFGIASVGRLACREEVAEWAEFGAKISATSETDALIAQLSGGSVIDATINGAKTFEMAGPFASSLIFGYVVNEEPSFLDLIWFWNTRAIRPGEEGATLLLKPSHVSTHGEALADYVRSHVRSSPSLVLASRSIEDDELRQLANPLGMPEHEGTQWKDRIFGQAIDAPTVKIGSDPTNFWFHDRRVGTTSTAITALFKPSTTVTLANPLPFAPKFTGVKPVELRLRSQIFTTPRRPKVAALFHPNATWSEDSLLISSTLSRQYEFDLQIPTPEQTLSSAVDIKYKPSDKARQLRAVLARESGRDLGLYRNAVTLAIIEALMPSDSRQLARVLKTVPELDRDFIRTAASSLRERVSTLNDLTSNLGPLATGATTEEVADALNQLVDRGHVDRGLRADCTLCDTRELRRLNDASPSPTCRSCGAKAQYELGPKGEPQLFYRLSPVMRIICASGGLPVLATVALLSSEGAYFQPGADAMVEGENFEVDILGWNGNKVFSGEVKRSLGGFKDVDDDIRKSVRFGADVHIAATLDSMDEGLREQLQRSCEKNGVKLRVLDGPQLLINDSQPS